jgi:hypothetical protein
MKSVMLVLLATLSLGACATPKEPDYSGHFAKEKALRELKAPKGKAVLYVVNSDEHANGTLNMFSGIKTNLGIIQSNRFHAYCFMAGDYSLVYGAGLLNSDPLPVHLEAGKVYGVLVKAARNGVFSSPAVTSLSLEDTTQYVNLRRLGPDPRFASLTEIFPQFPCDFPPQN